MIWFAASTPPAGFIECNGQSTAAYPDLGTVVGAFVPDLRGQFIRGWAHESLKDSGRIFGSSQDDTMQNVTGTFGSISGGGSSVSGPFKKDGTPKISHIDTGTSGTDNIFTFDLSRSARTSDETRPSNVALLPCIKT